MKLKTLHVISFAHFSWFLPAASTSVHGVKSRTAAMLFAAALIVSAMLHLAAAFLPFDLKNTEPDPPLLSVRLTEMPAPPKVIQRSPAAKSKPTRQRTAPPLPAVPAPEAPLPDYSASVYEPATELPYVAAPTVDEIAAPAAPLPEVAQSQAQDETAAPLPPPVEETVARRLPPRIDLVYKAYWGSFGLHIGEIAYRLQHSDNRYEISTIGEAQGIAALIWRGQGKAISRGTITATGLQPDEFIVERGSSDKRETAVLDWKNGIVTLQKDKTAVLELPTFDPLTLIWQFYFSPPTSEQISFYVVTPRRVYRYLFKHIEDEMLSTVLGDIATQVWRRTNDDGTVDAYVWLAPSMHYTVVKMRVVNKDRRTAEVVLDAVRSDAEVAQR